MAGEALTDHVVEHDREALQTLLSKARSDPSSDLQCEVRLLPSTGDPVWTRTSLSIVSDRPGDPTYVLALVEDISVQKQLEAKLAKSNLELQLFEESALGVVSVFDRNGNFLRWNRHIREILGYTDEEMVNLKVVDTIAPEDRDYMIGKINEVLSDGSAEAEFHALTKDGDRIPTISSAVRLNGDDGSPSIAAMGIDVSDLRSAQEALARSDSWLRALLDATDEVALLIKPDGTLLAGNEATARVVNRPGEHLAGENILDMMEPEAAETRRRKVDEAVRTRKAVWFDDAETDGTIRETTVYPVGPSGSSLEAVAVLTRDVTEARKLAERLMALSAHQVSVREDERARIAHEIHDELGQQLTVMKFDLSRIRNQLTGLPTESEQAVSRQIESLGDFLDIAIQTVRRISTELRPSTLDHFGLVATLENQASDFELRTGILCRCRFTGSTHFPKNLAITIFRICQEALTNVARHSGASEVEISLDHTHSNVTLQIQDNGRGATESELSGSRSFGLLSMTERARIANGTIEIEGRPGIGLRVTARFSDEKVRSAVES